MTIDQWLQKTIKKLESTPVPTARLDAEVLLADSLDKDRTWIHAHPEHVLEKTEIKKLDEQIKRRMNHEPLAYIRGKQEFYGRDFIVSPDTLTPRPETETLVELALKEINKLDSKSKKIHIADVGTGSGCIIISLALELAQLTDADYQISCKGLDISEPALEIAKQNAKNLEAKVIFKKFNLLSETLQIKPLAFNLVVANLPYVPNKYEINLAASHEPGFAIFGGEDGLDYFRLLFKQLAQTSDTTCKVITESLPPQHAKLELIANDAGFTLITSQDFIQVFTN